MSESLSQSLSQSEFDAVPLNVVSESTEQIKGDETPEVVSKKNPWWSWIPAIGGVLSIWDGMKKKDENEEDEEDSSSN